MLGSSEGVKCVDYSLFLPLPRNIYLCLELSTRLTELMLFVCDALVYLGYYGRGCFENAGYRPEIYTPRCRIAQSQLTPDTQGAQRILDGRYG